MLLREYARADCPILAELFYNTVHEVNAKDYSKQQLAVWATGSVDLEQWNQRFMASSTVVAEQDGIIVGFGNLEYTGYLDMLYVHKDYQRRGIAKAICNQLERQSTADKITTNASITAKAFFEQRGYRVIKEQQVQRGGVWLTNYVMELTR